MSVEAILETISVGRMVLIVNGIIVIVIIIVNSIYFVITIIFN